MTVDVKHKPLEISHHLKANDRTSMVVTTFYGYSFNCTHCYTWCVHCSSINRNKSVLREETGTASWRDFIQMEILLFRKQKKNGGVVSWAIKCTESDRSVIKLTKKKDLGLPFSIFKFHDVFNSWNGCSLNSCNTDVWYDNCILTIISQIRDTNANSCYTMMLFWWCCIAMMTLSVCVSCCRVYKA